jgi:hypothetical protein
LLNIFAFSGVVGNEISIPESNYVCLAFARSTILSITAFGIAWPYQDVSIS